MIIFILEKMQSKIEDWISLLNKVKAFNVPTIVFLPYNTLLEEELKGVDQCIREVKNLMKESLFCVILLNAERCSRLSHRYWRRLAILAR